MKINNFLKISLLSISLYFNSSFSQDKENPILKYRSSKELYVTIGDKNNLKYLMQSVRDSLQTMVFVFEVGNKNVDNIYNSITEENDTIPIIPYAKYVLVDLYPELVNNEIIYGSYINYELGFKIKDNYKENYPLLYNYDLIKLEEILKELK